MQATEITEENFHREVMEAQKPVLLDFYATWCGPCRAQAEILEDMGGQWKLCKVNIDDNPALVRQYRVASVPTLVVIKNGAVVKTAVGVCSKEKILTMLQS